MSNNDIFLRHSFLIAIVSLVDREKRRHFTSYLSLSWMSVNHVFFCGKFIEGIVSKDNGHAHITSSSVEALDHLVSSGYIREVSLAKFMP